MVNFSFAKREFALLAALLSVSFIIRLLLFSQQGFTGDIDDFINWFNTASHDGIVSFYVKASSANYPPFNVYIFWAAGNLASAVAKFGIGAVNIVKLVPSLFDMATGLLIYVFVRKQASFKLASAATALYVFNPAVIYDSAIWGQFDAIYTFFMILALMLALRSRPKLAAATYAIAILTKPQSIALLPVLAVLIYKKNGFENLIKSILTFAATAYAVVLPFQYVDASNVLQYAWNKPVGLLVEVFLLDYGGNKYTSVNAFNLWALWPGMGLSDGGLYLFGWVLFGVLAAFVCYFLYKQSNNADDFFAFFCAFMLFFGFFMLPTRIHERYLFPAMAVLALMVPFVKRTRPLYAVLTATLLVNEATILFSSFIFPIVGGIEFNGYPFVMVVSIINLVMLGYASFVLWSKSAWLKTESSPSLNETTKPMTNRKHSKNKARNLMIISIMLIISGIIGVTAYLIILYNLLTNYDFLFIFRNISLLLLLSFSCVTLFIGSYTFTINKKQDAPSRDIVEEKRIGEL